MSNTIMTIEEAAGYVAKGAAKMLENELNFCASIDKVPESELNGANGYSAGSKLYINKPPRFPVQTDNFDRSSDKEPIVEEKVEMPIDIIASIGIENTSLEFAYEMQLKDFMNRVIKPAISDVAESVEQQILQKAIQSTYNSIGTAGSGIYDPKTILAAKTKLTQYTTPSKNRNLMLDAEAMAAAANARGGYFNSAARISEQYEQGVVTQADGFKWRESEMLYNHTNGTDVTGVEVRTTVSAEGQSTLVVEGLTTTTGTVKKGSVFTIASVYAVNPKTKRQLNHLQQFVVTADATADGSGYATLNISPAIYTSASKGLQNVSAFPADGDAITFNGSASTSYMQGLAYHKNAFRMISVPLEIPKAVEYAGRYTHKGISMAIVRAYDNDTRTFGTRLDFLGGFVADRPEYACRVWG